MAKAEVLPELSSLERLKEYHLERIDKELHDEKLSRAVINYVFGRSESSANLADQAQQDRFELVAIVSDMLGSSLSERRDKGVTALLLATEGKAARQQGPIGGD